MTTSPVPGRRVYALPIYATAQKKNGTASQIFEVSPPIPFYSPSFTPSSKSNYISLVTVLLNLAYFAMLFIILLMYTAIREL